MVPGKRRRIYAGDHSGIGGWENCERLINTIHAEHIAKPAKLDDPRVLWFAERFGCQRTEETKRAGWVTEAEHPEGILSKPCPVCGYHYGHEWKTLPIPADVVEQIKGWAALDNTGGVSGYEAQARAFLDKHGINLRITKSDSKPAPWDGPSGHHYRVTLSRKGEPGRLTFDWWGSQAMAEEGKDPSAYSVLSCIASDLYTPETFEDYCSEYGEDEDSRKALQTFNRAHRHAERLRAFFADETEREELGEIR